MLLNPVDSFCSTNRAMTAGPTWLLAAKSPQQEHTRFPGDKNAELGAETPWKTIRQRSKITC